MSKPLALKFKPIYIQIGNNDPKPLPSTGNFGAAIGKQSTAQSPEDALKKAGTVNVGDSYDLDSVKLNTIPIGWIIKYRKKPPTTYDFSAGKRKRSKKGKKMKRVNKTRRLRKK